MKLVEESAWVSVGQALNIAGVLCLVYTLTNNLSAEQYGQLGLGLTVVSLINQVVMGGVTASIVRFYNIADEKDELRAYVSASFSLLFKAAIVVCVIGFLFSIVLVCFGFSRWFPFGAALLLFSIFSGLTSVITGVQNAGRKRALVAAMNGLDAWLKIGVCSIFIGVIGPSSVAVALGYLMSSMIVVGVQCMCSRSLITKYNSAAEKQEEWFSAMWAYSWPFTKWGFFTWMQIASDRWALQIFSTSVEVGQYSVLYQMGFMPFQLLSGIMVNFIGPILFQRSGDATNASRNKNVNLLGWRIALLSLVFSVLCSAVAFPLHEWIYRLFVSVEFRSKSNLLPWMILAGGIFSSGQILALKLMSDLKPELMAIPKIVTALLGVSLNFIGAAVAGINGVVLSVLVFSGVYFVWMAGLCNKRNS